MGSSKRGLRKRCPRCKKLRGFREPADSAGGADHPHRKPWLKIDGRWVCGWCSQTQVGQPGRGTVPCDDEVLFPKNGDGQ